MKTSCQGDKDLLALSSFFFLSFSRELSLDVIAEARLSVSFSLLGGRFQQHLEGGA